MNIIKLLISSVLERIEEIKENINNGYGYKCCKKGFNEKPKNKNRPEIIWNGHPIDCNGKVSFSLDEDRFCAACGNIFDR